MFTTRRRHAPRPSRSGYLADLHEYDPTTEAWTDLSVPLSGTAPSFRYFHGFASAGGKLYVHGGRGVSGEGGLRQTEGLALARAE